MTHRFCDILREHANSMWLDGWYTIANRLVEAADRIERLEEQAQESREVLKMVMQHGRIDDSLERMDAVGAILAKLGGDDD